jgi:hypothetical protein
MPMDEGHETPSRIERLIHSPTVRSTYASLVTHVLILIGLALLLIPTRKDMRPRPIVIAMADAEAIDVVPGHAAGGGETGSDEIVVPRTAEPAPRIDEAVAVDPPIVPVIEPMAIAVESPAVVPSANHPTPVESVQAIAASLAPQPRRGSTVPGQAAFEGRRGPARGQGVLERGGSAASEEAVERGLAWLARHQAADGSWRFDLSGCRCDGGCRDPGTVSSTTASTGIALLPFLGAGHTHVDGAYRETVTRGIYYLMSRMQPTPRGGDLGEGTMYGHGVATLALAEAFGMTDDEALVKYVRDAVRFIETAQDLHGGGWRYLPGQPGDTTVTAWQLAALKSAGIAGVAIPSPTVDGVVRFLDRVQVRQGEAYGYQAPQARPCTSAIGLLCRLYTAWPNEAAIDRGLTALAKGGPDPDAIYLNFYLSQALLQRDHPLWQRWNARNRDQLVARQAARGHEAGSWFLTDHDTAPGGRLAHTALAVLTLEVYYRLLPIYGPDAVAGGW